MPQGAAVYGCGWNVPYKWMLLLLPGLSMTINAQTPLPCGRTVCDTIAATAQTIAYTFAGQNGDIIRLQIVPTSGSMDPRFELFDPSGSRLVTHWDQLMTLDASGTYTVVVGDSARSRTGNYCLYMQKVNVPCGAAELPCGQVVVREITGAQETHTYTFDGAAGEVISAHVVPNSGSIDPRFELYTPSGSRMTRHWDQILTLNATGRYTFLVQDSARSRSGRIGFEYRKVNAQCPSGLSFIPVTPCRILDTRASSGKTGAFGPPALGVGTTREVPIPDSTCSIPSSAKAYSLNATVVPHGFLGYLSLWPTGGPRPGSSTLNSYEGGIVSNASFVRAGTNGSISVFATNATDLILDINGYFTDTNSQALGFYTMTPCRPVDTRGETGQTGDLGPPIIAANTSRVFPLRQSPPTCPIPPQAQAYSLNATVAPNGPLGYLTLWPAGQMQPVVSTLNSLEGLVVSNAAIVPAGNGGDVSAFVQGANTHLILDINGYFAPPGATNSLKYFPIQPCRLADTRGEGGETGVWGPPALGARTTRSFPVRGGACGIPVTAAGYALNITVVPPGFLGHITIWPEAATVPTVSTLNSWLGRVVANMALVPAGSGGGISVLATHQTHLIIDINGYFAP